MNILLINPPGKVSFISPPLGLLYISAVLKKRGHLVLIKDFNIEKKDDGELFKIVTQNKIEIVGLSMVTPKANEAIILAEKIKKHQPKIIIVAGGPHATLMPEKILLQCPSIDFIVKGEGEIRFGDLVDKLASHLPIDKLDGLVFRDQNGLINNSAYGFIENLNVLPMPDREGIDILRYSKLMKTGLYPATTMMTSRGCPYHCIYCSKPITGQKIRSLDPEKVVEEMEYLEKRYGIKEIIFYDDSFTIDRKRVLKICELIIKRGLKIQWQCETRVNLVDKELLAKMKEAGCYIIAFGLESGSDRILGILKKGINRKQIENAISITREVGIQIIGYFMLGVPGETEEEIEQTISFSKTLEIDFAQFSIATAYPGTELYLIAQKDNKINDDWSRSLYALGGKPIISLSDVSINRLYDLMKFAYRSFYFRPSYIISRIKKIRSFNDVKYNVRGLFTLLGL